jgi:aldose 1-epimerase
MMKNRKFMEIIQIKNKNFRCEIAPALGGAITGLWCGETAILRDTPRQNLSSALDAACYPLVPFSNRIENGNLFWQNLSYKLPPNLPPEPHATHGVGWQTNWQVLDRGGTSVRLHLVHQKNAAWPWGFSATQTLELSDAGLLATLSVTNHSNETMPAGLGWHPYFTKRPGMQISMQCEGRWELDQNCIPSCRTSVDHLQASCQDLAIDNCYDGWHGRVELTDPEFDISVASTLTHLVVYSTSTSSCIAIEPVSHVSNALAMIEKNQLSLDESGVIKLESGDTFSNQMMIAIHQRN